MERRPAPAAEVIYRRLKYFLTPQLDLYRNIREFFCREDMRILDYGCGTGVGTITLQFGRPDRVRGVDCDEHAIAFANDVFGHLAQFYCDDWTQGDGGLCGPGWLDLIACIEVIEHVDAPDALLDRLGAALDTRGGILVISTLNHNSQYRKNDLHQSGYRAADFREMLERHFAHIVMYDYTLRSEVDDASTVTPIVGVCDQWRCP